jgi:hypothetical protein
VRGLPSGWRFRLGHVGIAAVLYAGIAISLSFASVWVHVGNAQRVTYEMFVALALLSVGLSNYPRPWRVSVLAFWASAAVYVCVAAYDAEYSRGAVLGLLVGALG